MRMPLLALIAVIFLAVAAAACQTEEDGPSAAEPTGTAIGTVAAGPTGTPAWVAPPGFEAEIYPAPLPVAEGVNISPLSVGCPNPAGLEKGRELDLGTALEVLNTFLGTDGLDAKRRVTDPAFWPLLSPEGRSAPLARDWLEVHPASASPYGDLLANGCGKQTLELTSWVKVCPGPCKESEVSSPALIGHVFLIAREGHWLVWAVG
jgi:hypothetical protein